MVTFTRWLAVTLGMLLAATALTGPTLAATALSGPAFAASPAKPAAVVGMGDSMISGEGAGDYLPATNRLGDFCHRSTAAALGQVVLPGVRNVARVNLACAGATTANVGLGGQSRYGEAPQAQQLRTIVRRYDVRMVVLTVGVNDVGYANLVYDCVLAYLHLAPRCATAWTPRIQSRLTATAPKIEQNIADIRQVLRAAGYQDTHYTIVLQSYPSPTTGDLRYGNVSRALWGCPLRTDDGAWTKDWVAPEFTAAFARVAAAANVRFLDLAPALRGREACATGITRAQEWAHGVSVNLAALRHGIGPNLIQESAHVNALGQAQIGRCLSAFARSGRRSAKCVRQASGNLAPVPTALTSFPYPAA